MMDDRIEQFRKMAQANPEDDLAHFALGNALVEAERYAEAIPVLRHVVKINASYSRAYVLLANAQFETEAETAAIETLNEVMRCHHTWRPDAGTKLNIA